MATNDCAVFAVYRKQKRALKAKKFLNSVGFNDNDISILPPTKDGPKDFNNELRTSLRTGTAVGAIVGGAAFLVIGIFLSLEIIALPGHMHNFSPTAARFLMVIAGVVIGMVIGGLAGTLVGIGTPEPAGKRYASYNGAGGTVLSVHVHTPDDSRKATSILQKTGGQDITEMNEKEGWRTIHEQIYERSHYEPQLLDTQ